MKRTSISISLLVLIAPTLVMAQAAKGDTDHRDADFGEIVITGSLDRSQADLLAGTSIVAGMELVRDMRSTLGDVLTRQPGVSATSFGPNASRPVLRGLQGDRVRVLTDGIGSFDLSTNSVDHAVAINPLTADRIEVLRGPTALLFGSSAIGGVVNVIDSRIPRTMPDHAAHVDMLASYGSAARSRALSGRVDLALSDNLVAHVDASYHRSKDLRVGGFVLSPSLRAEAAASGDEEIEELVGLKGRLPNSAAKSHEVAGGLAWIGSKVSFGASVARQENLYGIPVRFETTVHEGEYELEGSQSELAEEEGHHGAEAVRLDMRQTRYDLRGEYKPESGFVEAVRLRAGSARYRHDELEETGEIGTSFFGRGAEVRADLVQRESNGWSGISGAQFVRRRVNIIGAEKFLPRSLTEQSGLFTLQSFDLGKQRVEAGLRVERARLHADADALLGNAAIRRTFTAVSGSFGGQIDIADGWRFGVNLTHAQRAPSAEELFSNGPHAGTQSFEVGNPLLKNEKSTGVELTLHADLKDAHLAASLYASRFKGFIYENATGAEEDELPVFAFFQDRARQWGFEIDASATIARLGDTAIKIDGVADYTRVTIRQALGSAAAPRIPALRLLGGLEASMPSVDLRAEVERVTGQSRVAAFETATPGYTFVNLAATVRPLGKDGPLSLVLSADNLFDVTARRHASFLKDYAPLPGRDIRLSLRFEY